MGRVSVPQRSGLHSNQSGLGTHGFSGYSFSSPSPPPPTSTRFGRGQPLRDPSSSLWREYTCWAYLRPNSGMWNKHGNRWNAHSYMFKVFDDTFLMNVSLPTCCGVCCWYYWEQKWRLCVAYCLFQLQLVRQRWLCFTLTTSSHAQMMPGKHQQH